MSTTFGQMVTLLLVCCFIWLDINLFKISIYDIKFQFQIIFKAQHYKYENILYCNIKLELLYNNISRYYITFRTRIIGFIKITLITVTYPIKIYIVFKERHIVSADFYKLTTMNFISALLKMNKMLNRREKKFQQ